VPLSELEFTRDFDLPPGIVWDALVDEVLVDGWLAHATIDPRVGGVYALEWASGLLARTTGVIAELLPPRRLAVDTDNIGSLVFSLEDLEGGTRGSYTRLTLHLAVGTDARMLATTKAYWRSNLEQLEQLLRGHPVDWQTWQHDRGDIWAEYLRQASNR
jgi:uncharacterized protein YndB with AHSA1/START domain